MKIHILGICGTFMGSLALLARELGHDVSGSDSNVYPPMSTQLRVQGIDIMDGYMAKHLDGGHDVIIVGNTMSRGNPAIEHMLNENLVYQSGPQWLAENVLRGRHVLAVAGTHGKTTTSSMLAWILEFAAQQPGFLIGGIAENFGISARLGSSSLFVVEADEYDTAFFDKRAKFIHYRARTLLLNNIEYDHADIYDSLDAIRRQFHHLVRTIPGTGLIVRNAGDGEIDRVLDSGCWTPQVGFAGKSGQWQALPLKDDYSTFSVSFENKSVGEVTWPLPGRHNAENALGAIACAVHAGIEAPLACEALAEFKTVKRRLELRGCIDGVSVFDDFAHHPTAIAATLAALRARVGETARIIAVLEPRSNTMRMGIHKDSLANSLAVADCVFLYEPDGLEWDLAASMLPLGDRCRIFTDVAPLVTELLAAKLPGDQVLVMSNGDFQCIHERILEGLGSGKNHG